MMNSIFQKGITDNRVRRYLPPQKLLLWEGNVLNVNEIMDDKRPIQPTLGTKSLPLCTLNEGGSVLLDFGCEIHGGIAVAIDSCQSKNANEASLHIRFGESAMECLTPVATEKNATNDHAMRDFDLTVPSLGTSEIGNTGFRFVRISCNEGFAKIYAIRAVFVYRDIEYKGSFECDDEMLNKIWETAVYTVHLNMQSFLWDGIKRDRLVWIGDMHPETSTIQKVFGYDECVPKSLDFVRDCFPPNQWMNTLPSYSAWWIIIHRDWYMQNGDFEYLIAQKEYLYTLVEFIISKISDDGALRIESVFIDWSTANDENAARPGCYAIFASALDAAAFIFEKYHDTEMQQKCTEYSDILKQHAPFHQNRKPTAALQALAGIKTFEEVNRSVLSREPFYDVSPFLGYYILKARGEAGDISGAIELMNRFWGKMLELGATTFFEYFDLQWANDAHKLDEVVPPEENDIHGDHGEECYQGFRHSLCHGWASGPAAFIQEYILGVKILEPGCKKVLVKPKLGGLKHIKGTYPTPYGIIKINAEATENGTTVHVEAPDEVTVVDED